MRMHGLLHAWVPQLQIFRSAGYPLPNLALHLEPNAHGAIMPY